MSRRLNFAEKPEVRGFRPPMVYVYEDATWEYKRLSRDLVHEQLPTGEEMNTLGREGLGVGRCGQSAGYGAFLPETAPEIGRTSDLLPENWSSRNESRLG
jgi:hypothetical protein